MLHELPQGFKAIHCAVNAMVQEFRSEPFEPFF
jgi:hypothetical protein